MWKCSSDLESMLASKRAETWARWAPVAAWMGAIFAASALPSRMGTPGLERFAWDDKLQHGTAYAILAALIWRAFGKHRPRWWLMAASILVAAAYGALDEWHQSLIPNRECSLSDWSTDAFGAALAAIILGARKGGDAIGGRAREDLRGERQKARER